MNLAIIVPRFNPCGYNRLRMNFHQFLQSLADQVNRDDVFVATALFPGQDAGRGWWSREPLLATDQNFLWQKESLINFAIRHLPAKYDAVAWIDADLIFSCPWWREEAGRVLQQYPVVQLFERIEYDQQPGDYSFDRRSRGYGTAAAGDRLGFRAPGGAIACRRELLQHGIYDRHPLGGGDEIFMDACLGRASRFASKLNAPFRDHVMEWALAFGQHPVGFVRGSVKHLWHGDRKGRQYTSRHQLLADHDFDPAVDLRLSSNGLLEWSSDKPALHAAVRDYFVGRQEDGVCSSPAPSD